MGYSRYIDSHPTSLIQAAEAIVTHEAVIVLECASPKEAATLRHKFYSLRYAYLHQTNEKHSMHKMAGRLYAVVEGSTLKMMPASEQPMEKKFGDAIGAAIAKAQEAAK